MASKNNVYRVLVRGVADGQMVDNILHYVIQPATGHAEVACTIADLLTGFRDKWESEVCTKLTSNYTVLQYRATEITGRVLPGAPQPTTGLRGKFTYGEFGVLAPTVAGIGQLDPTDHPDYPVNVTLPIQKVTGLVGRANRGLLQISPCPEEYGNLDKTSTAGRTAGNLIGLAVDVLATVGVQNDKPIHVIFQQTAFLGSKLKAATGVSNVPFDYAKDVQNMVTKNYLGTQKHRKVTRTFGD